LRHGLNAGRVSHADGKDRQGRDDSPVLHGRWFAGLFVCLFVYVGVYGMCVEDARWNEVSEETSAAAAVGMHSAVIAVQPTVLRSSFLAARTLYFPSAPLATILAWLVASFSHCVCVSTLYSSGSCWKDPSSFCRSSGLLTRCLVDLLPCCRLCCWTVFRNGRIAALLGI
jgi:hypothetical protein